MIRNKEVTKSLKELWKQHPKLTRQEKEKFRSQVAEISQRKRETAMGSGVGNLVTWQEWSDPGKTNRK